MTRDDEKLIVQAIYDSIETQHKSIRNLIINRENESKAELNEMRLMYEECIVDLKALLKKFSREDIE